MVLIQREAPYPHWEFRDSGSGDLLRVVPERGGLISGWCCGGRERLYLDLERFGDPTRSVRGGMPVLFPICGSLPGGELPLAQGRFALPQHGFARDLPWAMRPLDDGQGLALELEHSAATLAVYPFRFQLRLEVRLGRRALEIAVEVRNRDVVRMPFSFGLHPYFGISDLATARVEGLPARGLDQLTGEDCDTAQQIDLMAEGIDLLTAPAGAVRLLDPSAGTALELQPSAPLDLVVIWSEPPRPMVCVEPWSAPRGALVSGERRLEIAAGGSARLHSRFVALA
jgi:galactose mutarotase-like enzyme